ncbi:MAG: SsrA-binding protein SmpB [Phycisphaerales bacterium]
MAKKKDKPDHRVIENRRAHFDYDIGETVECGMQLFGSEVKSVRAGLVSLGEGYVRADASPPSLWLHGVNIALYGPAGSIGGSSRQAEPTRTRKLLAHKNEILKLWKAQQIKGNTLVPLKLYFKNGYAKCLIGVGTGRKRGDKREAIKTREMKRDIDRAMTKRK